MATTTAPTPNQPGQWIISKFGPPSVLQWTPFDTLPVPSDGEVLVRILVAGIGGVDNIQRVGGYVFDPRCVKPGFCPGYEFVGVIEKTGAGVSQHKVNDLVASMCTIGGYATHVVLAETELLKLEASDDPVKMGALPLNYMTAYGMLKRSTAALRPGSSILIGSVAGGVGTAVAQLATAFGMELKMFGTCSPSKFDFVKSLGVTPIDRHTSDIAKVVREMNEGQGLDVVYDAVGSKQSLEMAANAIKKDGKVIVIGVMENIAADGSGMQEQHGGFDAFAHIETQPSMSFFSVQQNYHHHDPQLFDHDFEDIAAKVRQGKLDPVIAKLFKLDDAVSAHEHVIHSAAVKGKMLFLVDAKLAAANGL